MASKPQMREFAVTNLTLHVAGPQVTQVDGHVTTRRGAARTILTVRVGDLIIYCYDAESMLSFHRAWIEAFGMCLRMRQTEQIEGVAHSRNTAAVVLRVTGEIPHKVNGIPAAASPTGTDIVRIRIGELTVIAHDRAAISSWNGAWNEALDLTSAFWPRPDATNRTTRAARGATKSRTGQKTSK